MNNTSCMNNINRQDGIATLLVTIVILALITFVTIYTSKTVWMEQRIVNAEGRAKQAFEAAESGLKHATDYLRVDSDRDDNGVLDTNVVDTNNDGVGDSNTLVFLDGSRAVIDVTDISGGGGLFFQIASQGFAADNTATRTITQIIDVLDPLPNRPDNPVTTKGTIIIGGSATVHNPEGHSTIWSGDNVALGSNQSTATEIANPNDANYPSCMDTPMTCSVTRSSNNNYVGVDVIEYDASLASLSEDGFFSNFFGTSKENYRESLVTQKLDGADANNADGMTQEIIWVDGDASFQSNTAVGTSDEPVIIIVDGNASFNGNVTFYGLVVVLGDLAMSGNTTIYGALSSSGNTSNTSGSLDVWYNSGVLERTRKSGPSGGAPGSWRDF